MNSKTGIFFTKRRAMKLFTISFLTIFLTTFILDACWIGIMANRFYVPRMGHLMTATVSVKPALFFYFLYACGIAFFVVLPGIQNQQPPATIFFSGLFFGLVAYGTYNLISLSVLKDWPVSLTVVDMTWGAIMSGVASTCAYYATKYFS